MEKTKKLEELVREELREMKVHTAGSMAKLAYKMVKEGSEAEVLIHFCTVVAEEVAKDLEIPWAYTVLKHLKGVKYPIQDSSGLKERLKGLKIRAYTAEEVVEKLHYPIKAPSILLYKIKLATSGTG